MVLDKLVYCLIASTNSNNDLIVFNLDKELLPSVSVNAFTFSHEEKTCLRVLLAAIDVLSKFFISEIIPNWLIYKVYPLQVVHIIMHSLKLLLSIPNLNEYILLFFHHRFKLALAVFVPSLENLEL